MAQIDFNGIDTTIHGPIRLGILAALQKDEWLDFTTLKKRLNVPDGALGNHLQKLEKMDYVVFEKEFVGRRPRTSYRMTAAGQKAFSQYLRQMQQLIDSLSKEQ